MINLREQAEANTIVEIRSGSHLYGTNTEESDEDFLGIFMPPEEYIFGLKNVNEIDFSKVSKDEQGKNTKEAIDRKLYEYRKFINLALANNPNILEILFVNEDNIIKSNEFGDDLLKMSHVFPSKMAAKKFIGYSRSQKHKMVIRTEKYNGLQEAFDVMSKLPPKTTMAEVYNNKVLESVFTKKEGACHIHCGDLCFEPGVYVKKANKQIKRRIESATNRTELIRNHGFDSKMGGHLIRLLTEGLFLLENGFLEFPLQNRETLLYIRRGKWDVNQVISYADDLRAQLNDVLDRSKLPAKPDYKLVELFTVAQMKKYCKTWY